MSEFSYLKEKRRMLESIGKICDEDGCAGAECSKCCLSSENNGTNLTCSEYEIDYPEEAETRVRMWSEGHPIVTNYMKFEEVFGFKPIQNIYGCAGLKCEGEDCTKCSNKGFWNWEYKKPEKKREKGQQENGKETKEQSG